VKVCVLFNPKAGSAGQIDALRESLAADPAVTLLDLRPDDDLARLVTKTTCDGYDLIAVAGGDGTVHAAVNGLLAGQCHTPLAVLPLGTGNDFCRTMGIPLDPAAAVRLLKDGRPRPVDVVRVDGGWAGYMVNAATGGFSGKVAAEVTPDLKAAWGPLAYLRGAVGPIADPPRFHLTVRFDDGPPERFDALNVVVANARTAAGGIPVAPTANPADGRLDVILVRAGDATTLDLSVIAARLMEGDYTQDENVVHRTAGRVEIESDPPLPLSIDGELCEGTRFTFRVLPGALRVLAGPDYRPEPPPAAAVEDEDDAAPPPVVDRTGLGPRLFGFFAGFLLLAKRSPPAVAVGLPVIAAAVLLFGWLASGARGEEWQAWNEAVLRAQYARATPQLDALARAVTWLGGPWGTTAVVAGLLAVFLGRKHYLTAATLVAVLAGVLLLEAVLKPAFAVARPDLFPPPHPARGYSFPSGHALRGVGVFGFLAAVAAMRGYAQRKVVWWLVAVGCVALAVGVCWSRVYLGVHWPTDVIAGGLAAAAWLTACLIARYYAMTRRGVARPDPARTPAS
jgi:diacylglycerol kinase (ATP)